MSARRFDLLSFLLGVTVVALPMTFMGTAVALDIGGLGHIGAHVKSLANIKKNLDGDVKTLTGDAKVLFTDKDSLMKIKDQLLKLAKDTKSQIDGISTLVGEVEGHIKTTQTPHLDDVHARW